MSVLVITAKCDDRFSLRTGNGEWRDGYVPHGIGIGGGDYIRLTIDMQTGKIANWMPISKEDIDRAWEE